MSVATLINGDREMAAAIHSAGMQPWDITMSDLLAGKVKLADFKGIVFVGGFSYADVLDSAKVGRCKLEHMLKAPGFCTV